MDPVVIAIIDWSQILPFALFGLVAAVAWMALEFLVNRTPRTEARLKEIGETCKRHQDKHERNQRKTTAVTRVLEKATPMSKPISPKNAKEQGKWKQRLNQAGFHGESAVSVLLGLKMIGLLVGAAIGGGAALLAYGMTLDTLYQTIGVAGVMFYLPDFIIWLITRKRKEAIFLGLPDALDLMVVCVEAGLGLDQAMRKVADEMGKSHHVIAEELGLCNLQLQMGRSRNNVLHELGVRTGVEDLRTLASIMIQADKFGSSIAQALRVQSAAMRTKRRQLAEEKAAKTAVQLIFPLVIFIFPGIFVVLVGPAAITMINEMFPKMSGTG